MPRGRKPTPNTRPDLQGQPVKPDWLDNVASAEWDSLVDLLASTGNLSVVDGASLAIYCQAFSRYRTAEQHIAEHGPITTTPNGVEVQSPWFAVARQYERTMLTILNQFGLNPRSRKAIKPGEKQPAPSKMAGLIRRQA